MIPSGSDSFTAKAHYAANVRNYFRALPRPDVGVFYATLFWVLLWGTVLILGFYFYAKHMQGHHRSYGQLYHGDNFAGNMLERFGQLPMFFWYWAALLIAWGLFFILDHIFVGYFY